MEITPKNSQNQAKTKTNNNFDHFTPELEEASVCKNSHY